MLDCLEGRKFAFLVTNQNNVTVLVFVYFNHLVYVLFDNEAM